MLVLFAGCEKKSIMSYEGVDGIYFDVQYGKDWGDESQWAHQNYTHISFGTLDTGRVEVRMKVGVVGEIVDYPRPFRVEIVADSTNAILDEEYYGFLEEQEIPAGANKTYVTFIAQKSERMIKDTVKIQFRLIPGEHFTLPFSEIGKVPGRWDPEVQYPASVDPGIHSVYINNVLQQPKGWVIKFGTFTSKKYEFLMGISGFTKSDFEDQPRMLGGRSEIIRKKAYNHLLEQYKLGRKYWVLDEDGSLMWVSGVSWAEGTRPEEIVD